MSGEDLGIVGKGQHLAGQRPEQRFDVGGRKVVSADRAREEEIAREDDFFLSLVKADAAGAMAGRVPDFKVEPVEGQGLPGRQEAGRLGHDQRVGHDDRKIQGRVGEEMFLGLVDEDRTLGPFGPHVEEARDVVQVRVRQHHCLRFQAVFHDVVDQFAGLVAAVDDPAGPALEVGGVRVDDVTVGLPVAKGKGFDVQGVGHTV